MATKGLCWTAGYDWFGTVMPASLEDLTVMLPVTRWTRLAIPLASIDSWSCCAGGGACVRGRAVQVLALCQEWVWAAVCGCTCVLGQCLAVHSSCSCDDLNIECTTVLGYVLWASGAPVVNPADADSATFLGCARTVLV